MKKNKLELTKEYIEKNPNKSINDIVFGLMSLLKFNKGNATAYYKKATASIITIPSVKDAKVRKTEVAKPKSKVKIEEIIGIDSFFEEESVIEQGPVLVETRTDIFDPNSKDFRDKIKNTIIKYGKYGVSAECIRDVDIPAPIIDSIEAKNYVNSIIDDDSFKVPNFLKRKIYKDEI